MKKTRRGAAKVVKIAYGEAITYELQKRKLPDVMKRYEPAKRSSAQTQPEDRRQL